MNILRQLWLFLTVSKFVHAAETFWQITDVHWDKKYSRTGDPAHLCHGEGFVADNGYYGNTFCDGNSDLLDLAVRSMARLEPNPDFILWTGDNAPHVEFPNQTWGEVYETCSVIAIQLLQNFPATKIVPVLGNHDTVPSDQFPADNTTFYQAYLNQGNWSLLIPEDQWSSFLKGGYYEVLIKRGLKVIVLNTGLYKFNNLMVRGTEADPSGQFEWFLESLNSSKYNNEMVIVTSHVAPGYFATGATELNLKPKFNDRLIEVIADNSDVILALIFGHEHMDTFRLFADFSGCIKTHAFLAGPVDVWIPDFLYGSQAVNAGIRLYSYNTTLQTIIDYNQYYVDFMQANRNVSDGNMCTEDTNSLSTDSICVCSSGGGCASVEKLYQPSEVYNVSDLSTSSMLQIYENLRINPEIFQVFYNYSTLDYVLTQCDAECKNNYICSIANITEKEMRNCLHLSVRPMTGGEFLFQEAISEILKMFSW